MNRIYKKVVPGYLHFNQRFQLKIEEIELSKANPAFMITLTYKINGETGKRFLSLDLTDLNTISIYEADEGY